MPLLLHRAPRADQLVEGLAGLLGEPLADPFAQELVLVPAKGIERWLSQQLSHRLGVSAGHDDGVCAGVQFRSPGSLIVELLDSREDDPWAPDAMVWPLLGVVDDHVGEEWCRTLSRHLGAGFEGDQRDLRRGRRYAVARRLAGLFAGYARQRPALLEDWEAGRDTDGAGSPLAPDLLWQAELWRRLVRRVGQPSPVVRHRSTVAALANDPGSLRLPGRLSLFGHTRIPVTELDLLAALARHRDVHLWLPHPSAAQWEALRSCTGPIARVDDPSHEAVAHPLLAALGRDLRELQRGLGPVVTDAAPLPEPVWPDTLLGWLQADLAANAPGSGRVLRDGDDSVQVHACHGPARQVEVLREVLLGLLADDPTLEPRDILVMCPDIEVYAPLVTAAFGLAPAHGAGSGPGHHPGHDLRVLLADRSLTQTNPLLDVVVRLLDLAGGRAEASRVLDLLATAPLRRRFGFSESDLEKAAEWVERSGIRWAFDQDHRAPYGLEKVVQNTWRFGLDRVLAGVAVSADADRYFGMTLPLDDVGSSDIGLAGRFAECLDRLQRITDRLTGERSAAEWLEALTDGVDQLTGVDREDEWQQAQAHRELRAAAAASGDLPLRLPDVRALMRERLAGRPTRANFRTGTLTVCSMVPMRSVPHRVVCLLGLDDGVFPRAGMVDGDDVLARRPLTGERDARSEDRQLLLDAIVAATDKLVVTYTGFAETTGATRPPAVPLQEVMDALEATVPGGRAHALERATLQAFDARNFQPGSPASFDPQALAGARAAAGPRSTPVALSDVLLPPVTGDDVSLEDLVAFFKNPVKHFLRHRLDVALPDDADEVSDAIPVEVDGLVEWQVGDRVLNALLGGADPEAVLAREWRRAELPPGTRGWQLLQRIVAETIPVATLVDSIRAGRDAEALDVELDLGGGRALVGTITGVYGDRIIRSTYSRLGPKQWLDAWIPLLAHSASRGATRPRRPLSAGAIGRGHKGDPTARIAWASQEDAGDLLRDLVKIYDAGMRGPIPLPLKTGHAWAERHRAPEQARFKPASWKWATDRYPGEDAAPEHVLVWGERFPLKALLAIPPCPGEEIDGETSRLGCLARRLWLPMLERGIR